MFSASSRRSQTLTLAAFDRASRSRAGYHLGEYRIPYEKSLPYDIDTHPPFFIRGPGIAAGVTWHAAVSMMDIGATMLELSGAAPPGARPTDGRSLLPLIAGGGVWPAGVRTGGLLVEHLGETNQWMNTCGWCVSARARGTREEKIPCCAARSSQLRVARTAEFKGAAELPRFLRRRLYALAGCST